MILRGEVIKGEGYGRKLGFPTANLDRREYQRRHLKIRFGVYVGIAEILPPLPNPPPQGEGKKKKFLPLEGGGKVGVWKAGIVVGPLDKRQLPKIEAHLIGFKGNLYGKHLMLILKKFIRPFKKFRNQQELKAQIVKDLKLIDKFKDDQSI